MSIGPTPPAGLTLPIRRAWADVYARWGGKVRNLGTSCCKNDGGTCGSWDLSQPFSQHSWGNAWDIGGPLDVLGTVAHYLARQPYAAQVLWQYHDLIGGGSVYDHAGHVHLSGKPMFTGVPPCAGGAASRQQYPAADVVPLPSPAATVAGESWAPVAKVAARELAQIAARIARAPGALGDIMAGR